MNLKSEAKYPKIRFLLYTDTDDAKYFIKQSIIIAPSCAQILLKY